MLAPTDIFVELAIKDNATQNIKIGFKHNGIDAVIATVVKRKEYGSVDNMFKALLPEAIEAAYEDLAKVETDITEKTFANAVRNDLAKQINSILKG